MPTVAAPRGGYSQLLLPHGFSVWTLVARSTFERSMNFVFALRRLLKARLPTIGLLAPIEVPSQ